MVLSSFLTKFSAHSSYLSLVIAPAPTLTALTVAVSNIDEKKKLAFKIAIAGLMCLSAYRASKCQPGMIVRTVDPLTGLSGAR